MASPHVRVTDSPYERCRRTLAVPVCWLAASLAMVCLVSPLTIVANRRDLEFVGSRLAGTVILGAGVAVGVAAIATLTGGRAGAGPSLAVGVSASVFGLPLAAEIQSSRQASLALVMLGIAVGGLLSGCVLAALELTSGRRRLALVGLAIPLLVGPPMVMALGRVEGGQDFARLVPQPPVWALAVAAVTIVLYSAMSLLMEPSIHRQLRGPEPWGNRSDGWFPLVAFAAGAWVLALLLAFQSEFVPTSWLRPLVIVGFGAVLLALVWVAMSPTGRRERAAYVGLTTVLLGGPSSTTYLVAATDVTAAELHVGWWTLLAVAALVGAVAGLRWPDGSQAWGLLIVAGACAGGWIMGDDRWIALAAAGPLVFGCAMVLVGVLGRRGVSANLMDRLALLVVVVLMGGLVCQVALVGWGLSGYLPVEPDSVQSAGRVMLGLTFAVSVLAAAYVSVLLRPAAGRYSLPQASELTSR